MQVGEKYPTIDKFKEGLTYYALASGFSLWYERSGSQFLVAKCGQKTPRLVDLDKGKQRKNKRYPCVITSELPSCPWICYARWMTQEKNFQIRSLNDEHTCVRNFEFGSLMNFK